MCVLWRARANAVSKRNVPPGCGQTRDVAVNPFRELCSPAFDLAALDEPLDASVRARL